MWQLSPTKFDLFALPDPIVCRNGCLVFVSDAFIFSSDCLRCCIFALLFIPLTKCMKKDKEEAQGRLLLSCRKILELTFKRAKRD